MELSRRRFVAAASAGVAGWACRPDQRGADEEAVREYTIGENDAEIAKKTNMTAANQALPTIYVPHGGGPWPFVDIPGMSGRMETLREYLVSIPNQLPRRPDALLVVSAHWEEENPTVQTAERPPMLYDYSGFPPESYSIEWPAPGSPTGAQRVRSLLADAGVQSGEDAARGFDHGTFVVTKLMFPDADIPTFQLSLTTDLNARRLVELGQALAPLRQEGVLILGSGYSYHNMRGFFRAMRGDPGPGEDSKYFDGWLAESLSLSPNERVQRLVEWEKAPRARACHPREEHLLPLMVCAGAAGEDRVTLPYREKLTGTHALAAQFG